MPRRSDLASFSLPLRAEEGWGGCVWVAPRVDRAAGRRRLGFTLVELLVVISIIGAITAVAVPTIFRAVASARNAKTKAELDMLHMALMNYKNEYGSFPPANMGPTNSATPATGLWVSGAVNTRHPAYKHLVRIFPRLSEKTSGAGSPYQAMSQMSPAQALVFWLQGFYENPEFPITNGNPNWPAADPTGASAGTRRKLFDFDESRLYAASNYVAGTAQTFAARGSAAASALSVFPVYFTGHPSCGLPYAYFDSRCYDNPPTSAASPDITYRARSIDGDESTASPYISSTPPTNPTWGQQHVNGDTFQIIAAGKDGSYGTGQAVFPATQPYPPPSWPALTFQPVTNLATSRGHGDNLTNFADRGLADAIEALKTR